MKHNKQKKWCRISIGILVLLTMNTTHAQTSKVNNILIRSYEGTWYNKENKRHISISFDKEGSYAVVNDWNGKRDDASLDVYKAFIKDDKLIVYAQNDELHGPYCEMEMEGKKLVYQCNEGLDFIDQFLNTERGINKTVFKQIK